METEIVVVMVHFPHKIRTMLITHCPLKGQNVRDICKYRAKSLFEKVIVELNLSRLYSSFVTAGSGTIPAIIGPANPEVSSTLK